MAFMSASALMNAVIPVNHISFSEEKSNSGMRFLMA
jgi:hypothetical protein